MERVICVKVSKEDYDKVMGLVRSHSNGFFRVVVKEDFNYITFAVRRWRFKRCKEDLNLAKALGVNVEVEMES